MKIAITGGSGFLGKATLAYAQSKGHDAWTFDRSDGNDIMGDLRGLDGAQIVIHLAGLLGTHELFDQVQDAIDVNVTGSYRIMQWCLDNDARYVGITMPDAFPSIYTATKIASQRLATALHHSRGLQVSHVRAFNAYGPGQKHGPGHPQKIIPTFATLAWQNKPLPIWGDGSQTVDLVHSDDVAHMLVEAAAWTNDRVFEAGTGVAMTVLQVAQLVNRIAGSNAGVQHFPMRDGEIPSQIVATDHEGWGLMGFRPQHLPVRLGDVVRWYQPK
jgi:UDP-glucose 4-epimerase